MWTVNRLKNQVVFLVLFFNVKKIRAELRLDDISTHPIHLEASNALTGVGLHAGLKWLSDQIMQTIWSSSRVLYFFLFFLFGMKQDRNTRKKNW